MSELVYAGESVEKNGFNHECLIKLNCMGTMQCEEGQDCHEEASIEKYW